MVPEQTNVYQDLRARGFAICKPDRETKKPTYTNWPTYSLEATDFAPCEYVGIIGGPLSDGGNPGHALVIIDLDSTDAVAQADVYLPATAMTEGRASKPRSHRYFLVPCDTIPPWAASTATQASAAAVAATGHAGPFLKHFKRRDDGKGVLDFVGTGGQCVCPPSTHPSGEARAWDGGQPGAPAVVAFTDLWQSVCELASACGAEVPDVAPRFPTIIRSNANVEDRAIKYLAKMPGAVAGQCGHGATFSAARALVYGFDLKPDVALRLLRDHHNPVCEPQWSEKELAHKIQDADRCPFSKPRGYLLDADRCDAAPVRRLTSPPWPELQPEALHGLAGRFVRALDPHTEASNAALLFQFLAFFGNRIGRTAHFVVEGTKHYCNEFACIVGDTARARKGTSLGRVQAFFEAVDPAWVGSNITSGLSSGEGLIHRVRDRVVSEAPDPDHDDPVVLDEGVQDKRLLVVEEEFAKVLKQADRQGNILSDTMRNVWDGKQLSGLTKNSPAKATGAHVTVVTHVTKPELLRTLSATDQSNGFGNRFLWVCSKRSKLLPCGGNPDHKVLAELQHELADVFAFAEGAGEITRDANAEALWYSVYMAMNQTHRSGIVDALLARDTAHVMRLSMMYAVLDKSTVVRVEHLGAAVAAWQYCEDSVAHLFGSSTGNPTADKVLLYLQNAPGGATRTEIRELVGGRVTGADVDAALALLNDMQLARPEQRATGGRPAEVWTATANGGAARG